MTSHEMLEVDGKHGYASMDLEMSIWKSLSCFGPAFISELAGDLLGHDISWDEVEIEIHELVGGTVRLLEFMVANLSRQNDLLLKRYFCNFVCGKVILFLRSLCV